MDKTEIIDKLNHLFSKIEFLKEALCANYETPLSDHGRDGLHFVLDNLLDDIEAVSNEISSESGRSATKKAF